MIQFIDYPDEVLILDLFGSRGGVGRCTRELIKQLSAKGIKAILCGESHHADSYRDLATKLPLLKTANLERPRFSLCSIKIKFARKNIAFGEISDVLLDAAKDQSCSHEGSGSIIVNFPQVVAPPKYRKRFSVLIYDLNWQRYPGNFENAGQTDRNCRGWVEKAERVFTISERTADEIVAAYDCDPAKVIAAPLAPFACASITESSVNEHLAKFSLTPNGYFLYPGVWGMHKGHETLTEAIEQCSPAIPPVVVTCGHPLDGIELSPPPLMHFRTRLAPRWDRLVAEGRLILLSGVPDGPMEALRIGCRAYVIPSEYEGFGFPLVEAIYHNRPAIVSDIDAHREILGRYHQYGLSTLFDAESSDQLCAALKSMTEPSFQQSKAWQDSIETTWYWSDTVEKMMNAIPTVGRK